uniref:Uncharacterized protein n=1 Tax=Meloidogyne incognita TaxID=6306 RepID=A0A914NEY8_MELIC
MFPIKSMHANLTTIYNNNVITAISMRMPNWFMHATQMLGYFTCKLPNILSVSINYRP